MFRTMFGKLSLLVVSLLPLSSMTAGNEAVQKQYLSSVKNKDTEFKFYYDDQNHLTQMRYYAYNKLKYRLEFTYDPKTHDLKERLMYEIGNDEDKLVQKYEYSSYRGTNQSNRIYEESRAEYVWSQKDNKAIPYRKVTLRTVSGEMYSRDLVVTPWDDKAQDWSATHYFTVDENNYVTEHTIRINGTTKTETTRTSQGFGNHSQFAISPEHMVEESTKYFTLKGDTETLTDYNETRYGLLYKETNQYRVTSQGNELKSTESLHYDDRYGYESSTHTRRTNEDFWEFSESIEAFDYTYDSRYFAELGEYLKCRGNYAMLTEYGVDSKKSTIYSFTRDAENNVFLGDQVASGTLNFEDQTGTFTADKDLGFKFNSWSKSKTEETVNGKRYICYTFIAELGENTVLEQIPLDSKTVIIRNFFEQVDEYYERLAIRQYDYKKDFSKSYLSNSSLKKFNKDAAITFYYNEYEAVVGVRSVNDRAFSQTFGFTPDRNRLAFYGAVEETYDAFWGGSATTYNEYCRIPEVFSQSSCPSTDQPIWNNALISYSSDWQTGDRIVTFSDLSDFGQTVTENHKSVMYNEIDNWETVPSRFVVYNNDGTVAHEQVYTYDKDIPFDHVVGTENGLIGDIIKEFVFDQGEMVFNPYKKTFSTDYQIYNYLTFDPFDFSAHRIGFAHAPKSIGSYTFTYGSGTPEPIGDVNEDGKVSVSDITKTISQYRVIEKYDYELFKKYDVDGNGRFDADDIKALGWRIITVLK